MCSLFLLHNSNILDILHLCIDFYLKFRKNLMVMKHRPNRMLMDLAGRELFMMISHIS